MRKTIIIGTGAVAAELTSYIIDSNKSLEASSQREIIGYIEYFHNIEKYWKKYNLEKPVLGDIDSFEFSSDVEVLIGISDIKFKNVIISKLLENNISIGNFIHHSVIIPKEIEMGQGNIIYPFCIIGPNCKLGDFNLITSYSFISHDCVIGNRNFFSTCGVAGKVIIGDNNFFGIRSTVIPDITIGSNNIIQAGMIVDKNIENDSVIFHRFKEKLLLVKEKYEE